ncbi:MAG: N-acetylmuramoyl-L-alanine amidase, partial [Epsilonproteobacteria bacterium]|nr:N-acetylmuramoyl-L-alanine amidase [Campylobacterota bacterium]
MRKALAILLLLLAVSLHAISDSALLKRAQQNLHKSSKTAIFNAYNDYKNLYLRAIIKENKPLKIKALKGIITTGDKLHI